MNLTEKITNESSAPEFELIGQNNGQDNTYGYTLYNISHDLRTPAAVLKSNLQLLKDFPYQLSKQEKEDSIYSCQCSLDQIINFLDKVQLMNIVLNSNLVLVNSYFTIKQIVNGLFNHDEVKQNAKRVKLTWEIKNNMVYADLKYLQQILSHLISNSIKFSSEEIRVHIANTSEYLSLLIKDYGIGIPEEEKKAVFDPFYKATNAQDIPGMGLGLAIVRKLANVLKAKLYLSSKVGQGTSVRLIMVHRNSCRKKSVVSPEDEI